MTRGKIELLERAVLFHLPHVVPACHRGGLIPDTGMSLFLSRASSYKVESRTQFHHSTEALYDASYLPCH